MLLDADMLTPRLPRKSRTAPLLNGPLRPAGAEKWSARARADDFRDDAGLGGMHRAGRRDAHERLKWAALRAARARAARARLSNSEAGLFWTPVNAD